MFDDSSLFLSSSFNYFCSNYNTIELVEEGKKISNLIDKISNLNEDQIENNSTTSNGQNNELKKKLNISEDESSSLGSKFTKKSQVEENKQKYNICLLNYNELINLLDIDKNNNNENNIKTNKIVNEEKIKMKLNELEKEIKNNGNIKIKNNYLRKMVCLKLYKALKFALKNFNLEKNEIKQICLYIENQGRTFDSSMTNKYKEYIENVLKKISHENKLNNFYN